MAADLRVVPPAPPLDVPPGWKLVPIKPTNAQLAAAVHAWRNDPAKKSSTLYTAMVEAAPAPRGVTAVHAPVPVAGDHSCDLHRAPNGACTQCGSRPAGVDGMERQQR